MQGTTCRKDHLALLDAVIVQAGSDKLDQATLLQLLERHHALMSHAAPAAVATAAEFHAMLTPEQKTRAVERLKWFKEKHMH